MKIIFVFLCIGVFMIFDKFFCQSYVKGKGAILFIVAGEITSLLVSSERFYTMMIFFTYLTCLFFQDHITYYISRKWLIVSLIVFIVVKERIYIISGCVFGLIGFVMHLFRKDWIGSADVCFLFYFGFLLGYERMVVMMLISISIGFIYVLFSKRKMIPFVSCMCIGSYISMMRGYSIWMLIYDILLS